MGLDIPYVVWPLLASAGVAAYYIARAFFSELDNVRGPQASHLFLGNMGDIISEGPQVAQWTQEYGRVFRYNGILKSSRVVITDFRGMQHVLQHSETFHKPRATQQILARILGRGVLLTEGEQHRRQRKALNPAFGPNQLRDLTGIFLDKANELRDVLDTLIGSTDSISLDVMRHLSNCTLDIIGLAGFGYSFNALPLNAKPNELSVAFNDMLHALQDSLGISMLEWIFPFLRFLPTARNKKINASLLVMRRIGQELLHERKIAAELDAAQGEKITESRARDVLSLLVRANLANDPRQRISDEDVLAQIPTFLAAGHETTATLTSWTLYRLALHPDVQAALRAECREHPLPAGARANVPLDVDRLSSLDKLPLLDAVIRETLRLDAPVPITDRAPIADTVVPLDEPLVDAHGRVHESLALPKGTVLTIPIFAVNSLEELWGPDGRQWRPQRWTDGPLPEAVKHMPGVFGNIMSFIGGAHGCIGYRFSLYEAKIILHALVSNFEFSLAVPQEDIGRKFGIVSRPFVKSQTALGTELPLIVKRAAA